MGKIILAISLVFLAGCGTTMKKVGLVGNCEVYQIGDILGYTYITKCDK